MKKPNKKMILFLFIFAIIPFYIYRQVLWGPVLGKLEDNTIDIGVEAYEFNPINNKVLYQKNSEYYTENIPFTAINNNAKARELYMYDIVTKEKKLILKKDYGLFSIGKEGLYPIFIYGDDFYVMYMLGSRESNDGMLIKVDQYGNVEYISISELSRIKDKISHNQSFEVNYSAPWGFEGSTTYEDKQNRFKVYSFTGLFSVEPLKIFFQNKYKEFWGVPHLSRNQSDNYTDGMSKAVILIDKHPYKLHLLEAR